MKWAVLVARILVGLLFTVSGVNHFAHFFPNPPPANEMGVHYLTGLSQGGYMDVVHVIEVVGGVLLLVGRFVPVGLMLLTPVSVNVALYELLLNKQPGPGVVLTLLCAFLIYGYRGSLGSAFSANPPAGWWWAKK